jgi:hypothetical protein
MRVLAALAALAALSGCGEQGQPAEGASQPDVLTGRFSATSDAARQVTGDLVIERGGLVFDSGEILYTRVLNPRRGVDPISRDGASYAALSGMRGEVVVELRRITEQTVREGGAGVCHDARPAYAALVHETSGQSLMLLVFEGEEPPGPQATESRLCGTYAFAVAEVRAGVML